MFLSSRKNISYVEVSVIVVLLAAGCGESTTAGADASNVSDSDAAAHDAGVRYSVGGMVAGLEAGDEVRLVLNDEQGTIVGENGAFAFPEGLADGAAYSAHVVAKPAGKSCALEGGEGVVASSDVTSLVVTCEVSTVALSGLELTPFFPVDAILEPAFSPDVLRYDVSVPYLGDAATFAPAAVTGTSLYVNGVEVASGESSAPVRFAEGNNTVLIRAESEAGATQLYEVHVERRAPKVVHAPGGTRALAIEGDTAVLALNEATDDSANGNGLHIYRRENGSWVFDDFIAASEFAPDLGFAGRVVLKDDLILAGVPSALGLDGSVANGAVYLFRRVGGDWVEEAVLRPSIAGASFRFGTDVAAENDRVIVGAPQTILGEGAPIASGAVFVFERSGDEWTEVDVLVSSNAETSDDFGESVALAGNRIAVGAPGENSLGVGVNGDMEEPGPNDVGAAYLFENVGGLWLETTYVKTLEPIRSRRLGTRILLRDDLLVVAARADTSLRPGVNGVDPGINTQNAGAVFAFRNGTDGWAQEAYIKAPYPAFQNHFGWEISLNAAGDVLAVGAHGDTSVGTGISEVAAENQFGIRFGAVEVYGFRDDAWHHERHIKTPVLDPEELRFGLHVGYVDGRLLVGGNGALYFY